jgi:hypothetical protein
MSPAGGRSGAAGRAARIASCGGGSLSGGKPQPGRVEVAQADRRLASRGVFAGEYGVQRLGPGARRRHRRGGERAPDQRQVQLAVADGVESRGHRQIDQFRLGGALAGAQAAHRPVQPSGDAGRHSAPQYGRRFAGHHPDPGRRGEGLAGRGEHAFAGRGDPYPARGAVEQAYAEFAFEPGDLLAHRRLHDVQSLRRAPEVQFLGDGDEVLQRLQFPLSDSSHDVIAAEPLRSLFAQVIAGVRGTSRPAGATRRSDAGRCERRTQ